MIGPERPNASVTRIDAMKGIDHGVEAWFEPVAIRTYPVGPAERCPMFLEGRVYQGSSGRVYPLPVHDSVGKQPIERQYPALHLENRHVYVMVLPELGGRVHIGYDKDARYDFFYRQNQIKPALVGLAGPWISGGVEFNWPQHHRPSTFMPCAWHVEADVDGATLWLSEHEPMTRMKGMHGVRLRPDSALLELRVRLYNRTPQVQTFLWWANVAARVHEAYQSFFPADVRHVADHAKRATSCFPACEDSYYGVRYGLRQANGVPAEERPPLFPLPEGVDANRLDWYANIPVPTSYMVASSAFGFFGGYDHQADAGFVHVADRHVSPGKKQWTWGNHAFGYAWDRNLTEDGGPYVELMAGVYTDNQPDFAFLAPFETKAFSQYWYPIRLIGPPSNATRHAAISIHGDRVGVCPSGAWDDATIEVETAAGTLVRRTPLSPTSPYLESFASAPLAVRVRTGTRVLVEFDAREVRPQPEPIAATEPPEPGQVQSADELYRIGTHLEQYRHATRSPEPYWEEALARDPDDTRCLVALAKREYARGLLETACTRLHRAVSLATDRNPNPYDGEAHYQLGLCMEALERVPEAIEAYGRAAWSYGWKSAALLGMARCLMRVGEWEEALSRLETAKPGLADANALHCMEAAAYRHLGDMRRAGRSADYVLAYDPLDPWALYERMRCAADADRDAAEERLEAAMPDSVQHWIDLALDLRSSGCEADAVEILRGIPGRHPMVAALLGEPVSEADELVGLFPSRLAELIALQRAVDRRPTDWAAHALLGHMYYDKKRYEEAITHWERSVGSRPGQPVVWRCLGVAYANIRQDDDKAQKAYEIALEQQPDNQRLVYEYDQLLKKRGTQPHVRLKNLQRTLVAPVERDDLTLELASLLCFDTRPAEAVELMESHRFAPWEGGEGLALGQHARAHRLMAERALREGDPNLAILEFERALSEPVNLGEARHALANVSDLWVGLGEAMLAAGRHSDAAAWFARAADFEGDFQEMAVQAFSEMTAFRATALRNLGRESESASLLRSLLHYAEGLESSPAKIDYFATSLPDLLLFRPDLRARQVEYAQYLKALAWEGLGDRPAARLLLESVLGRNPNHERAHDLLGRMA